MGLPTTSSRAAAALAAAFVGPSPRIHGNSGGGGGLRDGAIFSPMVAEGIRNPHRNPPVAFGYFAGRTVASAHRRALALLDPTATTAAIDFFRGMQFPAMLVAGASLAGLFAMTENVNDTSGLSKLQIFLLRLYHVTSMLSFCLSLSSIVTSATASTLLLLSEFSMVPKIDAKLGLDAYQFLRSNMNFEFLFTRWSFLVSVAFLFTSTAIRMLLQFELFKPKRRLAGWSVISTMTGVLTFIAGYANTTQHCWPSFWGLTREIFQIVWKRAFINRQPMFLLSLASFAIGTLLTIKFLMPGTVEHDQLVDTERYT